MSYVNLLSTLPTVLKAKFRKLENVSLKIINCKWSQIFNKICLKENLMLMKVWYVVKHPYFDGQFPKLLSTGFWLIIITRS